MTDAIIMAAICALPAILFTIYWLWADDWSKR